MRPQGLHIIADLFECDLRAFAETKEALAAVQAAMTGVLKGSTFKELGSIYHYFGPQAATGVICLAESHITFHTWPEHGYVSVDLYLCNSTPERMESADNVLRFLEEKVFHAGRVKRTQLVR